MRLCGLPEIAADMSVRRLAATLDSFQGTTTVAVSTSALLNNVELVTRRGDMDIEQGRLFSWVAVCTEARKLALQLSHPVLCEGCKAQ